MKKHKFSVFIIALLAAIVVSGLWFAGIIQGLENLSFDLRFNIRGHLKPSPDIVIVAFDEESFAKLGRWPWDRKLHGKVVDNLKKAGAKAIVFDMLLIEPDKKNPASDSYLFEACKKAGNVVFASYFKYDENGNPTEFLEPMPKIQKAAKYGFSNVFPELDGVCRKAAIFKVYDGKIVPSISLAGLSVFEGKTPEQILSERKIKLDRYNELIINFAGEYNTFPYFSFYKVLNGETDFSNFKGKIVLFGGTAAGLFDFKPIPFVPNFPGVEIHANAISNMLLNNYIRPVKTAWNFILIIFFAFLPVLALSRYSPAKSGIIVLSLFIAIGLGIYYFFAGQFIYIEFAAPAISLLLSYGSILFYKFMTEEKEKRRIKKTFGQYLSATVMENILSNPESLKLGGERKNLTVLFSDIRGFTTISESLRPEEVVELLNEYLSKMVEVVFKYDGTLDKFIGDAVMAFWGAPVKQNDHAKRAVLCAVEMIEELKKLQDKWRQEGKKVIEIGIGVNTGDMIVGNMGSKDKMEYTVIGDNVNLGSRLEGLNKEFKTDIIISQVTNDLVKDIIDAKPLGTVNVKGKTQVVEIYQVLGRKV